MENETTEYQVVPLKMLHDVNSRYFAHMKHCFRFNMELPDPSPREDVSVGRQSQQLGSAEVRRAPVVLVMLFCSGVMCL